MALLFDRAYSLLIGETNALGVLITNLPVEESQSTANPHALHLEFKVDKSDKAEEKPQATFTVFNLSSESISRISKDQKVIFEAGYKEDFTALFLGQVQDVSSEVSGQTVKTTIKCVDGYVPVREGFTSRTFSPKSSVETILRTIITQDLGFPNPIMKNGNLGNNKGIRKVYQGGSAKIGDSAEIVTKLCKENFLTWIVRDSVVLIYPVDGSTEIEVPLISADSGMIGSPQKSQDNTNKLKDSKDLKTTYKVKTLLQGAYNIGDLVQIDSQFTNGRYRISKVSHSGSYDGGNWFTDLVVSEGVAQ